MELTASELWTQILDSAESGLPEQTFRTWLADTKAYALSDDGLLVEVPSEFHEEWLADKYGQMLEEIARRILGRALGIEFRCTAEGLHRGVPSVEVSPSGAPEGRGEAGRIEAGSPPCPRHSLNGRYTFDRFVVGNNNQLAAAACHAVAEKPARMYNPLFLYGGVGLGKTHLMHAIGNFIVESDMEKRVAYVPSEQFTNELVTAIQEG
ncbi:MAG: chromosomal replication initiator protein DnaA, partial [Gemmatimonadetes bacterium]|nr:chromosomal replication initiator protein DnaA [Gemmatimonadota bacterium]NIR79150.1 chromosomal replication initiator protein DnaA [Gemmatimonadota bacterium]NIT87803.1 chromosomal replication initiator protein DnaA [Gemmatimonadota bacterium]NIU31666.1 chromosomal replication initiator protein DnaA [Gemmatimonadota bacterium]NIU36288.1 chromosomal replication initiator protein DnaA [Gemmatimonadota bacterium]